MPLYHILSICSCLLLVFLNGQLSPNQASLPVFSSVRLAYRNLVLQLKLSSVDNTLKPVAQGGSGHTAATQGHRSGKYP